MTQFQHVAFKAVIAPDTPTQQKRHQRSAQDCSAALNGFLQQTGHELKTATGQFA
ncbi:hypothetical protein [Stenomitos frigidus]|uniref:hypothetical protein n=1 Tax=Stenomitos frigidus TaxID=1886765 RepID=UPI0015E781D1|nr:hypothetical protein [Stenomitos frigidus]